jgi:hypothetical protein
VSVLTITLSFEEEAPAGPIATLNPSPPSAVLVLMARLVGLAFLAFVPFLRTYRPCPLTALVVLPPVESASLEPELGQFASRDFYLTVPRYPHKQLLK